MPLTHERSFRVRNYECDPYGHLNNTVYLRYMQETAYDASAALGFDQEKYAELGHTWIARDTEIEYIEPVRYGDAITIRTWVEDFRRVRSRRAYEFYSDGSNDLVARAHTDWVYIERESGAPAAVPADMVRAFLPDKTGPRLQRDPFPEPPAAPPGVFSIQRRAAWMEIDALGHVNNAEYLAYIEECGVQVLGAFGWSMQLTVEAGFAIVARRHRIEYQQAALLDDELEIATWISDVKRATCIRNYAITRLSDEAPIVRARTLWVWVAIDSGRPIRIPSDFIEAFGRISRLSEPPQ